MDFLFILTETRILTMTLEKMDEFFNKRADTYDDHMITALDLTQFYKSITCCFTSTREDIKLLDLGCGTGLLLEGLFKKYPNMSVTGVDLSPEMLNLLKSKYPDKSLSLLCNSYFDIEYIPNTYDYVLSTYSLHHFTEEKMLDLYRKIYLTIKTGGQYILGDYTVKTQEEQDFYQSENIRIRKENNILGDTFYHYDTPLTALRQCSLLKEVGFNNTEIKAKWDSTTIIVATK